MNRIRTNAVALMIATAALSCVSLAQVAQRKPSADVMREPTSATTKTTPTAATTSSTTTPQLVTRPATDAIAIPTGTAIRMRLERRLTSVTNKVGDEFSGRVTQDVVVNGKAVIPAGSSITGQVTSVSEPRRIAGRPSIELIPRYVLLPNGKSMPLTATAVDTSTPQILDVNDEGRIRGGGREHEDNVELAAGTGVGAVTGAIFGGMKGTVIGAAAGAGATTIHWLTKRHTVDIPAGTEIIFEVSGPVASATSGEAGQ